MAEKAQLETETGERITCLFNPSDLSLSVSASWSGSAVPGMSAPNLEYGGGESATMSLELFFDTTKTGESVATYANKLIKLTHIDTSLPGYSQASNNGRPPWVKFHWGSFHSFKAAVTSVSVNYVYFHSDGTPLRATVSLDLRQYEPEDQWPAQNPTSGTPRPNASHQVQPGENLSLIAARYYGDATHWRPIAASNNITDPFRLKPGAILDIPHLER